MHLNLNYLVAIEKALNAKYNYMNNMSDKYLLPGLR